MTTESTLMIHSGAWPVTQDDLRSLHYPQPQGPRHQPVHHADLVGTLKDRLMDANYHIHGEQYALYRGGQVLFGLLSLQNGEDSEMGIRAANDRTMSIQIAVGRRVTVCDNMVFSGDLIALRRRHTTGLDLPAELDGAIKRFQEHQGTLSDRIRRANATPLTWPYAKGLILDAFVKDKILPMHLLPQVYENYFNPSADMVDCQYDNLWCLHNAFTRAARGLKPARFFEATTALGRMLETV